MTELTPEYTEAEGGAGYGKVVRAVVIGLKTVKGTKQLKLDPTIYDALTKEKVQVGGGPCRAAAAASHACGSQARRGLLNLA